MAGASGEFVVWGLALNKPEYIDLWHRLNPDPTVEETIRNYPIRQPALWI